MITVLKWSVIPERSDIPLAYSRLLRYRSANRACDHQQAELAQLVARPTEDRKVTRSIRVHGIIYFLLFDAINVTGGVAKWSTAVDSNLLVHHQLLFEGAGSNPVSVALLLSSAFASNTSLFALLEMASHTKAKR